MILVRSLELRFWLFELELMFQVSFVENGHSQNIHKNFWQFVCNFWFMHYFYCLKKRKKELKSAQKCSKVLIFQMRYLMTICCKIEKHRCKPNELKPLVIYYISIICSRYVLSSEWWETLPNWMFQNITEPPPFLMDMSFFGRL